jgi:Fe-S cluster assembly iron-binding protein IscA
MAAVAAILDLISIDYLMNAWVDWSTVGNWRKIPVDNQCRHSFKMASTAAILDLVSVDYLTNASVDWSDFFVAYWG